MDQPIFSLFLRNDMKLISNSPIQDIANKVFPEVFTYQIKILYISTSELWHFLLSFLFIFIFVFVYCSLSVPLLSSNWLHSVSVILQTDCLLTQTLFLNLGNVLQLLGAIPKLLEKYSTFG